MRTLPRIIDFLSRRNWQYNFSGKESGITQSTARPASLCRLHPHTRLDCHLNCVRVRYPRERGQGLFRIHKVATKAYEFFPALTDNFPFSLSGTLANRLGFRGTISTKHCGFETAKGVTAEVQLYAAVWRDEPKIWIL